MRTIKANTKANGDILPEPQFKRIPVRVDKNTIILVREGFERGRASKKIQEQGQHAAGIHPVVLKNFNLFYIKKRATKMIKS